MNAALWIGQGLLAVTFTFSGLIKVTQTKERIIAIGQTGVAPLSLPAIRFTAICELLAVVGLIAPWATGIAPVLTPLAAVGLAILMVLAGSIHAQRHEPRNVATNLVLLAICVFVAVGRFAGLPQ